MSQFRYWNENPQGVHHNDCVTRAITFVSNIPYNRVRRKLYHTARLLDCEKLCWTCYSFLLTNVLGYRQVNCDGMTIGEFADLHPHGTYLIRIDMHLTAIKDGNLHDTFDCRDKYCHIAWKVN
jgi:hypothetical protein